MAKIIGGGFAGGAFMGKEEIMSNVALKVQCMPQVPSQVTPYPQQQVSLR